ncbi:MAG: hypothetical protein EOO40_05865 [Deltaproteobacteria bacterium]|nr:MAG: hypothetical protein EOO40_05865 [Deltaproteobacteria bacterium]
MKQNMSRAERLGQLLRKNPDQLATTEFSTHELEAARAFGARDAAGQPLVQVTLKEAASWIAQAGQVDMAQSINVTDSIALKRGLATVALYVGLTEGAPQHSSRA